MNGEVKRYDRKNDRSYCGMCGARRGLVDELEDALAAERAAREAAENEMRRFREAVLKMHKELDAAYHRAESAEAECEVQRDIVKVLEAHSKNMEGSAEEFASQFDEAIEIAEKFKAELEEAHATNRRMLEVGAAQESEIAELRADARRYRWLREKPTSRDSMRGGLPWSVVVDVAIGKPPEMRACFESELDLAIDAAIAKDKP
jgi:chromosome segregation ATPase